MAVLRLAETIEGAEEAGRRMASTSRVRLDKEEIQGQIDKILKVAQGIAQLQPDEAMSICSANLAYLTEIYIQILRVEHVQRDLKQVRTQEVVMTMELLRDSYKIASRLITVRGLDQDLTR